jgi:S1 RNA binding domain protein
MAIEVGSHVSGKVTGITNFGAFIDLGDNKTGLVHISEIADHFVKDINDELDKGQMVTVKVINIEDDGKIGLSLKQVDASETDGTSQVKSNQASQAQTPAQKPKTERPRKKERKKEESFDDLMDSFLKDSEERLSSLRKNTESKRSGGRRG